MRRVAAIGLICALVAAAGVGCKKEAPAGSSAAGEAGTESAAADPATVAKQDAAAAAALQSGTRVEAMAFFDARATDHAGIEVAREQAYQLAADLYSAGADGVWAAEIVRSGAGQLAGTVIAELPTKPGARAQAFAVARKWCASRQEEAPADGGQKYLALRLD